MPDWLTVVIACATPGLAYLGVLTANRNTRAGAAETESRERRKQNIEVLFKAVEWSTSSHPRLAAAGVAVLERLEASGMLEAADQPMLDGAYEAVVADAYVALGETPGATVVQAPSLEDPEEAS